MQGLECCRMHQHLSTEHDRHDDKCAKWLQAESGFSCLVMQPLWEWRSVRFGREFGTLQLFRLSTSSCDGTSKNDFNVITTW